MQHLQKAKEAFKWTLYLRGLSQITTWAISLIVIRFLTPSDYGMVALTEIIFMFMMLFCSAGLGDTIIQKESLDDAYIGKTLNLILILTGLMCLLLFLMAPYLAKYYEKPELKLVFQISSFVFLFTPWLTIASSILAKNMDFKSRGKVDLFTAVCTAILSLILAYNSFGFWSLILANFFNILLRAIGYTYLVGKIFWPIFNLSGMLKPLKFGMTIATTSLVFVLFLKIDVLVIADSLDTQTLGYYALAMHLAMLPMVKIMPLVNEVSYPMYSEIKGNQKECTRVFLHILKIVSFIMFPAFFIFSAVAEELVVVILGDIWRPAATVLQIIALTIPLRIISDLFTPLLKAMNSPQTGLKHVSFSCLVVAIVFYFATPYGLTGLSYAWLIATPIFFTFSVTLSTKVTGVAIASLIQTILKPIAFSSITLAAISLLSKEYFTGSSSISVILIECLVGLVLYISLSWLFNREQFETTLKFRL